ncbi:LYR motif-containing protein 2 [Spea bombifrons]|uniref:LYR motif-containing protein 2 n=1 Tax=Spea bombifrons TaxID=233779 RepID=UPI00234BDABE|nr:LYR motif-containing protein 2 [Spea bombifrons]
MAASRLPPGALSLRQFVLRRQVLGLYRDILRAARKIPDPGDRRSAADWARQEFKRNKGETEQVAVRLLISQGQTQLQQLEKALHLAGC